MTQREEAIVRRYERATATTLRDVYGRWSDAKEQAYKDCIQLKVDLNGDDFRILGANSYGFSCAFTFTNVDGKECLMYCTASANKVIVLDEEV